MVGSMTEAPTCVTHVAKHYQLIIAIGDDHFARITIDEESLEEIARRVRKVGE
jgi:hypothetical protein